MTDNISLLYSEVLEFWFDDNVQPLWFVKDLTFDNTIRRRFGKVYDNAVLKFGNKEFRGIQTGKDILALVIIFDQFSRNMFRGTAQAFATDDHALILSKKAVKERLDHELTSANMYNFLYMPFMHSENLSDQEEGIRLFSTVPDNEMTVSYAKQHRDIIARFGRFPHRNKALERESTPEEEAFMKEFDGF